MPSTKKSRPSPKISPDALRRAMARLKPPGVALPRAVEQNMREIKKVLARRPVQRSAVQAALKKITASPVPSNQRPPFPGGAPRVPISPWQIRLGSPLDAPYQPGSYRNEVSVYLPQDAPPYPGGVSGVYTQEMVSFVPAPEGSGMGFASASPVTGVVVATVNMDNVSLPAVQAFAGVFCLVSTSPADYGQIGRMTVDPSLGYSYAVEEYIDPDWFVQTGMGGGLDVAVILHTSAYEYDVVNGEIDPVGDVQVQIYENPWAKWTKQTFNQNGNNSFPVGSIPLTFTTLGARTYLVGVWAETVVTQAFQPEQQGGTVPPPGPNQLVGYGQLGATVNAIWITHEVLEP
jgi:hypothetical protein